MGGAGHLIAPVGLLLCLVFSAYLAVPPASSAAVTTWGYIPMHDGVGLRYTLIRPEGDGQFPTIMSYQGYSAGSDPRTEDPWRGFTDEMVGRGYAVIGVSIRGTGCSGGDFDYLEPQWGRDGAAAVEWVADRPWSNGRVGMAGFSWGGFMQLMTAGQRPPHLRAIVPGAPMVDLYREVVYIGGIPNAYARLIQGASSYRGAASVPQAIAPPLDPLPTQGDERCRHHVVTRADKNGAMYSRMFEHSFHDAFWAEKDLSAAIAAIDVPMLTLRSWQDEQLGSRVGYIDELVDVAKTWTVAMNGHHGMYTVSHGWRDLVRQFFARYLHGADNGWEATPRVQIWHEMTERRMSEPSWSSTYDAWPETEQKAWYARAGGLLATQKPSAPEPPSSYRYPLLSAAPHGPFNTSLSTDRSDPAPTWKPVPPGGSVAFTTGPLKRDLEVLGPGSADLWIASTATDADVQVTISEIRPDGQELYVQRGWLRLSRRKLDDARSTAVRPWHTHREADAAPLDPGTATPARVEIWPFNHVFRAGSRLRLTIDAPTTPSGTNGFEFIKTPATNTIFHDKKRPTRVVLPTLPGGQARTPLPPCGALANQPCRPAS